MVDHNKITFCKEYCRCRHIPYRFNGEQLILGRGNRTEYIFSVYNFTYKDLLDIIDRCVYYNDAGFFDRINTER